jgi:hypothetical protein
MNHNIQHLFFKVFYLSLIVCVFLVVYELIFMVDKEYLP